MSERGESGGARRRRASDKSKRTPPTEAVRQLGLVSATAIVCANMIGTGIFVTTGFMAGDIGNVHAILFGWFLGGTLALCGAACYAELGAMWPRVGGEYVYLREAYHPWVGFLSGWVSLIAGFSAPIAAAALAFDQYLGAVVPGLEPKVAAYILIAALTLLHMVNVALGSAVQNVFTVMKVALIIVFVVAGLTFGDGDWGHFVGEAAADGGPGFDTVFTSMFAISLIFVMFTYSGWNAAAYIAGEIKDPGRTLPRSLLLGTAIVTALYLLLNVVYFYAAPPHVLASAEGIVGDVAARILFGDSAGKMLSTLIALALVSSVSAMVMAGPRVYAAMAEDGMFFKFFARRNTGGAPFFSVILQGLLACVLVSTTKLGPLIRYIGFTLSVFAALTVAGVIVMRIRKPDMPRPYKTFGYPVTPILFVVLSCWMAGHTVYQKPLESFYGVLTVLSGMVLYLLSTLVNKQLED